MTGSVRGTRLRPPQSKKVLVSGGGPGGLYAAYTAARRGDQVILCEKEDELGGILKSEQALPFKYEMYQLTGTYEKLARDAGVEIRLNTEVTEVNNYASRCYDELPICAGRWARGLGTCSNPPGKTENRPAGTVWILLHCYRREFHRTLDGIHGMKSRTRKPLCFVTALPSTSAHPQAGTSWAGGRTPTPPPPAC